ncbi:uncharacterized protein LOC112526340 [Cynara cardunculus var. scolymus]|uniref:uncharacterized protein LOC112526340 n=1 Tax=Cynara cardunculus var. scolymus TaxID=59895 RepID=UPI000D62D0ED|nr:uncharacterized protein LOC112526340 [Cynara cardunculus var. scolymus]
MKIFNWVHRRFHQKDEVGQDAAKTEVAGNGRDKLALLKNAALDSVFDGWKEGILSIGTLGLDPALLKDFKPEDDMYLCEIIPNELFVDDDGGDQEREMNFPLVLKACKHGFLHDQKDDHHPQYSCDATCKPSDHDEDGVEDLAGLDTDQVKKERKAGDRITLADLFWADSEKNLLKKNKLADNDEDHVKVLHYDHDTTESNTKHASNDDRVALISKKNPAHPIKKINRVSLSIFLFFSIIMRMCYSNICFVL